MSQLSGKGRCWAGREGAGREGKVLKGKEGCSAGREGAWRGGKVLRGKGRPSKVRMNCVPSKFIC